MKKVRISLEIEHVNYDPNVMYTPLLENYTNIHELRGLIKVMPFSDIFFLLLKQML